MDVYTIYMAEVLIIYSSMIFVFVYTIYYASTSITTSLITSIPLIHLHIEYGG